MKNITRFVKKKKKEITEKLLTKNNTKPKRNDKLNHFDHHSPRFICFTVVAAEISTSKLPFPRTEIYQTAPYITRSERVLRPARNAPVTELTNARSHNALVILASFTRRSVITLPGSL